MTLNKLGIIGLAVILASGCAAKRELAEGGFDYLEVEDRGQLTFPSDLDARAQRAQFQIPELSEQQREGSLGPAVSVRSPAQVLTLAPGSRVDEATRDTRISFDAVEGVEDLPSWIWNAVEEVVAETGARIVERDNERLIVTAPYRKEHYSQRQGGFLSLFTRNRINFSSEQVLRVEMQSASHRRSSTLDVTATDIQWLRDGRAVARQDIPVMLQRDLEADFLNAVSRRLAVSYEGERLQSARAGVEIRRGETADSSAALILDSSFNVAWALMPGVLERVGFAIEDLNQSEGTYYTSYEPGGKRGFFRRLAFWSRSAEGDLDLSRGTDVVFTVDERDGTTYIVAQIDDEPVSAAQLDAWFPVFADAFRDNTD